MGVIGSSGGGYATVNPTQGNPMGEALQNVENSAFKYNAIKRENQQAEAEQQKALRDAKDKELKENQEYASKHKIPTTGIGSIDKAALDFLIDNKNLYNVAKNTYKNSNSDEERRNALETMTNLETSVDVAKALPEMLNTSAKDLEDGVRQKKYNPLSSTNAAKTIEAMSKGDMKVVFKSNGIPTFITYKRDGQGNLTEIIDKEMTMEQLKQKIAPIMNYSSEMNNEDFKKGLPKDAQEWEVGDNVYKGYKDIGVLAEQHANSIVTNRDKMYGVAADAGVTPKTDLADYTTEEIDKVRNYIKKGLEDKYKPSITTNNAKLSREQTAANQAADNTIARENLEVSKANSKANIDAKKAAKNTITVNKKTVSLTTAGRKRVAQYKLDNPEIKKIDYDQVPFEPGEIETVTTTYSVVKKTNPTTAKQKPPAKKQISRSEIASKAKAAGYSTKEYEALLIKKGISIKN